MYFVVWNWRKQKSIFLFFSKRTILYISKRIQLTHGGHSHNEGVVQPFIFILCLVYVACAGFRRSSYWERPRRLYVSLRIWQFTYNGCLDATFCTRSDLRTLRLQIAKQTNISYSLLTVLDATIPFKENSARSIVSWSIWHFWYKSSIRPLE